MFRLTGMNRFYLVLSVLMAFCAPAWADSDRDNPDRIIFGVGAFNATDADSGQRQNEFRLEGRFPSLSFWHVHPWAGLEFATKNVSWVGAGLETDIPLWSSNFFLTLQTGAGYFNNGDVTVPNHPFDAKYDIPKTGLEFRHQLELAYQFPAGNRIGLGISHMSNAQIANKGNNSVQAATINFHIPLGVQAADAFK